VDLHYASISELGALLRAGQISSVELTQAVLDRLRQIDPRCRAFVTVSEEPALRQAALADERIRKGDRVNPLTGIPFAVKDCISTRGIRTTCSSRILQNYIPPYDAAVIERLSVAGAVLVGKNNMDEFGMGSSCENSAFFESRNPWDPTRVPGGSSGGSAVAVAAGMATFSLGEDTGGSIRMPAAFCGVTGLKPTYGRVSRYGLIALASSFDTIGPITRSVYDNALVFETIAGHDPRDSTSLDVLVPDYMDRLGPSLEGVSVGIPREYFVEGMEPGVEQTVREAIRHIQSLGARVVDVSLPHTRYAIPVYYLILFAEASANLARFDGMRFGLSTPSDSKSVLDTYLQTRAQGFGAEVKRRIMLGTFVLSAGYYDAYYSQAQKVRTLLKRDFETAFAQVDALLTPVCPTAAFRIGEKVDDPLSMYLSDIYVTATNPVGNPALTVPCGFYNGLPIGLQIHARHLAEETLFRIGHAFQLSTDWHTRRPPEPDGAPLPASAPH
jgi:aspartyl-tRNA(Asn)/glutamyl-tRNA(Gln) amidotransferase subunit A